MTLANQPWHMCQSTMTPVKQL